MHIRVGPKCCHFESGFAGCVLCIYRALPLLEKKAACLPCLPEHIQTCRSGGLELWVLVRWTLSAGLLLGLWAFSKQGCQG